MPFTKTEPTPEDLRHIEVCKAACTCPKSGPSAPTVGLVWQPAIIIGHAPRCPALELIWARRNRQAAQANPFWENPPGWDAEPPPAEPKGILLVDHVDQLPIMPAGNTGIAEEPPPAEPKGSEFVDMRIAEVWVGDGGATARNVETGEVISVDELRKRTLERYGLTEPKG